jgi:Ca2+-binding EF-hand superfamily protein
MQSLGFDSKNPTIFQLIAEMDTPEVAKKGGIDFDNFLQAINDKLGDKESEEGLRRIFGLFLEDGQDTITVSSLKKIAKELGENMSHEDLVDMLAKNIPSGAKCLAT